MIGIDLELFRLVLLSTDLLLFVLLVAFSAFLFYASGRPHYRTAWRQIGSQALPMVCMGICLLYTGAGTKPSTCITCWF